MDWMTMSLDARNLAYNNGEHVGLDYARAKTESWIAASKTLREQRSKHLDLPYAPGERTKWDLYPATAVGIHPSTPRDPDRHGASICIDGNFDQRVVDDLHRRRIYIWGGRGRLRISFHGFNRRSELDTIVSELLHELG